MTSDTLARVCRIVARHAALPVETIHEDSRLEDLGIDSLGALELVFEIEEEFAIKVPDDRIPALATVKAVCEGIEALRQAPAP